MTLCPSDLQFRYKEAFLRDRGLQIGYRSINDDPRTKHFLNVGRLQSDNEYRKDSARTRSQFHSRTDQTSFLQAKRSQQLASDVHYRQPLPQPTSDPEQLSLKHAQKAHLLQSDVSTSHVPCSLLGQARLGQLLRHFSTRRNRTVIPISQISPALCPIVLNPRMASSYRSGTPDSERLSTLLTITQRLSGRPGL